MAHLHVFEKEDRVAIKFFERIDWVGHVQEVVGLARLSKNAVLSEVFH